MTKSVIWIIVMAALVAGVGGIALIASSFSAAGRAFVTRAVGGGSRWLVFACATGMTAGSLYFSEVAHFNPCRLCWFQRIFAYPIVIVMFFAARRRDDSGWAPAMTLAGIGSLVSVYHIAIENGVLAEGGSCDPTNPCTVNWLDTPGVPEPITMATSSTAIGATSFLAASITSGVIKASGPRALRPTTMLDDFPSTFQVGEDRARCAVALQRPHDGP